MTPPHSTVVGSSIASDNRYDQVAMFPETTRKWMVNIGVFDFDAVAFRELWERKGQRIFNEYVRYYLSDHRVMWWGSPNRISLVSNLATTPSANA